MPDFKHSQTADAVYIRLSDPPYSHGRDVELLGVSGGVRLDDLPQRDTVERLLAEHRIPVFA